jgi:plastocyanin
VKSFTNRLRLKNRNANVKKIIEVNEKQSMKMHNRFLMAAVLMGAVQMASGADITGKITLKGTPPPEKELPLDASCAKERADKPTTRFYMADAKGGLADTFVYIKEGLKEKNYPVPSQPVIVDQKGCEYLPYVFGVQAKQTIQVKNSDNLLHNVHPTPAVAGNPESNRAQMAKGAPLTFTFDKPELYLRFKCDVHIWMLAYACVVDHPFFSVSEKDGTFKIANVPPGKYVIEAYHRKAGKKTMEVTVGADGSKADFTLEVAAQ